MVEKGHKLCIDKMRRRVPTVSWPVLTSKDGDEQPVDFPDAGYGLPELLGHRTDGTLLKAIESLPEYYRDTVSSTIYWNTRAKKRKRMSCPVGTVKSRLSGQEISYEWLWIGNGYGFDCVPV